MNKLQLSLAALAGAGILSLSTIAPASADSAASTRNIIIGAAALAGFAIESNVSRKNARTHTVSGYLPDGSAVYADGHVVSANGYSYYPSNRGQSVSCDNGNCFIANTNANDQNGNLNYGRYDGNSRNSVNGYDRNGGVRDGNDGRRYASGRADGQR